MIERRGRTSVPGVGLDLRDRANYIRHVSALSDVVPKDQFVLGLATGRRVLDLGCIDHAHETALGLGDDWLHARLREVASDVVGLDMLEADAAELNRRGFDIRVGDAETFDLGETFDVIVAGDLIEHLSNIGRFLEAASRHMHRESLLVITTPNPFNVEQFAQALFRNQIMANPEHTVWIDPRVMHELVSRSPFEIADFRWIDTRFHFVLKRGRFLPRVVNPLSREIMRRRPICRRDFAVVLRLKESAPEETEP